MWLVAHLSEYSLRRTGDTRHSGLQWVLHNWRLAGGVKQGKFCGEESFMLQAAFKICNALMKYYAWWVFLFDYILIELISVHTTVTQAISSSYVLILSPSTTYELTALHFLRYTTGKKLFSFFKVTHCNLHFRHAWFGSKFS